MPASRSDAEAVERPQVDCLLNSIIGITQHPEKVVSYKPVFKESFVADSLDATTENHQDRAFESFEKPLKYHDRAPSPPAMPSKLKERKIVPVLTSGDSTMNEKTKQPSKSFIEKNVAIISQKSNKGSYSLIGSRKATYAAKSRSKQCKAEVRGRESEFCTCNKQTREEELEGRVKAEPGDNGIGGFKGDAHAQFVSGKFIECGDSNSDEKDSLKSDVLHYPFVPLDIVNHGSARPALENCRPFMEPFIRGHHVVAHPGAAYRRQGEERLCDPCRLPTELRSEFTRDYPSFKEFPLLTTRRNSPAHRLLDKRHARPYSYPILAADHPRLPGVSPIQYSYQLHSNTSSMPSTLSGKGPCCGLGSPSGTDSASTSSLVRVSKAITLDHSLNRTPGPFRDMSTPSVNSKKNKERVKNPVPVLPRGLGRDVESEEYVQKKCRADKQRRYAELLRRQHKGRVVQRAIVQADLTPDSEDKLRQSKRFAALEYARNISKPVRTRSDHGKPEISTESEEEVESPITAMRRRHEEEKQAISKMLSQIDMQTAQLNRGS